MGLCLVWSTQAAAQDAQFSQFFATRLYVNPAFAGNTHYSRVSMQFRRQWPNLAGYTTSGVYYDQNLPTFNSGLGLSIIDDRQAAGGLRFLEITGMYSYRFKVSRKSIIRLGIASSYSSLNVNTSQFTFTDQLLSGSSNSVDDYRFPGADYFDFNTGGVIYSERYWLGVSLSNMNNFRDQFYNPYPLRFSAHGGVLIPINKNIQGNFFKYLTIAGHYKAQQDYDQLDVGAYYGFKVIFLGLWYRGLLGLKENNSVVPNHDAFVIVTGVSHEGMRLSYSYDISASSLHTYSGGAHEVTLQMELFRKHKYKRKRNSELDVPCPAFGAAGWSSD